MNYARCILIIVFFFCFLNTSHSSIIIQYEFNGDVLDSSGNHLDGSISGSVSPNFVSAEIDQGICFNNPVGTNYATMWVSVPDNPLLINLSDNSFSWAFRYKSTDTSQQNGRLFGNGGDVSTGIVEDYNAGNTGSSYTRGE